MEVTLIDPPPPPGNQSSSMEVEVDPLVVASENVPAPESSKSVSAGSPVPPGIVTISTSMTRSIRVVTTTSGSDLPKNRDSSPVQGVNTNADTKPLFSSSPSSTSTSVTIKNEKEGTKRTCDTTASSATPDVIEVPTVQLKYMRRHQAAKSAFLKNRDYFREVDVGKPPFTYPILIGLAISEWPKKLLTSHEIVDWLETHFRYFKEDPTRTLLYRIRYALKTGKCFTSVDGGGCWKVNQKEFYSHRQQWTRPKELNSFVRQRSPESGGSRRPSCMHCEATFSSQANLKGHMINVHPLIHYAASISIPAGWQDMLEAAINKVIRRANKMDGGKQFYCHLCFKVGGVSKRTHVLKCHFDEVVRALSKEKKYRKDAALSKSITTNL